MLFNKIGLYLSILSIIILLSRVLLYLMNRRADVWPHNNNLVRLIGVKSKCALIEVGLIKMKIISVVVKIISAKTKFIEENFKVMIKNNL